MDKIALVDLDGTLADYDTALKKDLATIRSPYESLEYEHKNGEKRPAFIKERERLIRSQPGWWLKLNPLKNGFDIVEVLKKYNFDLHILTKAPHSVDIAWTEKVQWCKQHMPGIDITISQKKSLVYGAILVDDWLPYVESWLEWRPRGLVVMPDQPHNRGFNHPQVVRYDGTNIDEVENRIKIISARIDDILAKEG
jgi:5'-nucleotidase